MPSLRAARARQMMMMPLFSALHCSFYVYAGPRNSLSRRRPPRRFTFSLSRESNIELLSVCRESDLSLFFSYFLDAIIDTS